MHPAPLKTPNKLTIIEVYLVAAFKMRELVNNEFSVGNCKRCFHETCVENGADKQITCDGYS